MANKINIVGNLGKDPELRYTKDGKPVCSMSVASTDFGKTTWFRVTAWDNLAENCNQYLEKGRKVSVWGRMQATDDGSPRVWTDNAGNARASYEVTAESVEFLGGNDLSRAVAEADEEPF